MEDALFANAQIVQNSTTIPNPSMPQRVKGPYTCPFRKCPMKFPSLSDIYRHYRTHTGSRPFKCAWPYCNQKGSRKKIIQRHVLTVHLQIPAPLHKTLSSQQMYAVDHFLEILEDVLQKEQAILSKAFPQIPLIMKRRKTSTHTTASRYKNILSNYYSNEDVGEENDDDDDEDDDDEEEFKEDELDSFLDTYQT